MFFQKNKLDSNIKELLLVHNKTDNLKDFVIKKNYTLTDAIGINKVFLYIEDNKTINFNKLLNSLQPLWKKLDSDLLINLESFKFLNIDEKKLVKFFVQEYLYYSHKLWNVKTTKKEQNNNKIYFYTQSNENFNRIFDKETTILKNLNSVRDFQIMAPNYLTSEVFADKIKKEFENIKNIELTIFNKEEIIKNNLNLLLAVNSASIFEPRFIILKYTGNPLSKTYKSIVGKGISFDTGGVCLKPPKYQLNMKYDMTGAAEVCFLLKTLAQLKVKENVIGIACVTDNAIGSSATLTEAVITSYSKKTVEIINTDAEGRLVIADGLSYAAKNYNVSELISLGTLTGSISIALDDYTGAFTKNNNIWKKLKLSSIEENEKLWQLPMCDDIGKPLFTSKVADIKNCVLDIYAGHSKVATFLEFFTDKKPFMHIDIAGSASTKSNMPTAAMFKTLVNYYSK